MNEIVSFESRRAPCNAVGRKHLVSAKLERLENRWMLAVAPIHKPIVPTVPDNPSMLTQPPVPQHVLVPATVGNSDRVAENRAIWDQLGAISTIESAYGSVGVATALAARIRADLRDVRTATNNFTISGEIAPAFAPHHRSASGDPSAAVESAVGLTSLDRTFVRTAHHLADSLARNDRRLLASASTPAIQQYAQRQLRVDKQLMRDATAMLHTDLTSLPYDPWFGGSSGSLTISAPIYGIGTLSIGTIGGGTISTGSGTFTGGASLVKQAVMVGSFSGLMLTERDLRYTISLDLRRR